MSLTDLIKTAQIADTLSGHTLSNDFTICNTTYQRDFQKFYTQYIQCNTNLHKSELFKVLYKYSVSTTRVLFGVMGSVGRTVIYNEYLSHYYYDTLRIFLDAAGFIKYSKENIHNMFIYYDMSILENTTYKERNDYLEFFNTQNIISNTHNIKVLIISPACHESLTLINVSEMHIVGQLKN